MGIGQPLGVDVQQQIRNQGNFDVGGTKYTACAASINLASGLKVLVLDERGQLWLTPRTHDGSWPLPWSNVNRAVRF